MKHSLQLFLLLLVAMFPATQMASISVAQEVDLVINDEDQEEDEDGDGIRILINCLLYTSPSPRDATLSRMPSSA